MAKSATTRRRPQTSRGDVREARLLEIAVGKRVYITYGPAPDPYDGWYGALGWGISEDQEPTR